MKKALKWAAIVLGGVLGLVAVGVASVFLFINYQGEQTDEQKNSLETIKNLSTPVKPGGFSENLPDVEPEIYDDRHFDHVTMEEELEE